MERKLFENVGYQSISIDYDIFNYVMPIVSGTEWKILCFMFVRTAGYRKTWAAISYTEIQEGTGIVSRTTVSKGLKELVNRGMILSRSQRDGNVIPKSQYAINQDYKMTVEGSPENGLGTENEPTSIVKDNTIVKDKTIVLKKEKKINKEKKEDGEFLSLLPERFLQSKEFVIVWKDFLQVRKEKKVPVTKTAAKRHIRLMNQYNVPVAIAMIDTAINKGWRGIFELEDWHPLMRGSNSPLSDAGESQRETLKSA